MKHAGKLPACALLGESQLRREPSQLECSSFQLGMTLFQFSMTLFQLRMTLPECLLSLLVQGPLSLFIAACLENLLGVAEFCDVQVDSAHPCDLPVGSA